VLLGRRPPSDEAREIIATIEESGARVRVVRGDVASALDVQHAIETAGSMAPLGGVIHAAGVIDDGVLLKQSWERFDTVMRPKIQGSWNLHLHTRKLPIDFFVLFSTGSALLGSSGQGNYSSANAFLDGLAHHRRASGLPATSINWGAWSGVGMAAALTGRDVERWSERGSGMIEPEVGVHLLNLILDQGPTQIAVLPIDWSRFLRHSSEGSTPRFLAGLATRADGDRSPEKASSGDFLRHLETLGAPALPDAVRAYVEEKVARVLGLDPSLPLPPQQGLSDLGMDSLMAVELSNHFANGFGRKFPSTLAFEYGTIALLSDYLAREVLPATERESLSVTHPVGGPESEGGEHLDTVASVADLNEEEAELRLVAELDRAGY
jgi:acyl carrier protein